MVDHSEAAEQIRRLQNQLASMKEDRDELQQGFDLRWAADMRAIKRWREAAPGRELTLPDHADLCVWLLEQLEAGWLLSARMLDSGQREKPVNAAFRVVVYGGRDWTDRNFIYHWLGLLFEPSYGESKEAQPWWLPRPDLELIFGGAKGVDSIAEDWAVVNWVKFRVFKADWDKHGRAAGPIRNQQMIDEGKPEMGIAFPGGKGTADMTARLRKAGIAVLEIPFRPDVGQLDLRMTTTIGESAC
jgi:hypothetical protein